MPNVDDKSRRLMSKKPTNLLIKTPEYDVAITWESPNNLDNLKSAYNSLFKKNGNRFFFTHSIPCSLCSD